MADNSNYQFNSLLIRTFQPGAEDNAKNTDKLKYHYTSPDALLSILKNQKIFFTDIRFLNDKSEDIYLVKLILDLLDENEKEYPTVREVTNELFKNNKNSDLQSLNVINIDYSVPLNYIPMRKFVFCTTTETDQLNMWNYYVHNGKYQGYNIGFNIEKLLKSFDTEEPRTADPFKVVYGKVLYDKKKQYEEILRLFEEIEIRKNFSQSLDYIVVQLRYYIDSYGAFFKNPSFKAEKEYRICIEIDDERLKKDKSHFSGTHNRKMKYDYRTSNGLIVPYIAVEFEKEAVSTIHMSPMTEFQIAKESLREVLNDYHYDGVQIWKSQIPIRF